MKTILTLFICLLFVSPGEAQQHAHMMHGAHGHQPVPEPVFPPRVFLNKKPNVIAWQLKRLENYRLLLVDRSTDDPKFRPVYREILTRIGMSRKDRNEALDALVKIDDSDNVTALLATIESLDPKNRSQRTIARQLTEMLVAQNSQLLVSANERLLTATKSTNRLARIAGFAGLITSGETNATEKLAANNQARAAILASLPLVPDATQRIALKELVFESLVKTEPVHVRLAAISALDFASDDQAANFLALAPLIGETEFRDAAVQAMLKIPAEFRDGTAAADVVAQLIAYVDETPADKRTTDAIIDSTQLASELLVLLPADAAAEYREQLKTLAVRRVRINTVDEEMRYDLAWFAVESGSSVQVELRNADSMPHNLVITVPGAMREMAESGAAVGPRPSIGLPYVPMTDKVLQATGMVQAGQEERITFEAPNEPGEYPYVCTFPGHWMRMYGVMVVVDDLDAFLKNPVEPADPTGISREFVKAWTMADFETDLKSELEVRLPDVGMQIFAQASCAQCHQMKGIGGAIGPELSDVIERWKGDYKGVLREILDPSHKIDEKYTMQTIETIGGLTISGLITKEDERTITIVENPLSPQPTVVNKDDIEDQYKATQSMMPKSLMDRFTREEILEMLAYIAGE